MVFSRLLVFVRFFFFFFFSSRRRHTRWPRDWSSDVCSSDLGAVPNRIRHSTRSPSASQKLTWRKPKRGGNSQFHRCSTTSPPMKINSSIPKIASGAMKSSLFTLGLMFSSSHFCKFVVNVLQSLAQMQHGIAFAREQRVHAHAGLSGHLLETTPFQLVRNKHLVLLLRQLVDRQLEFLEKQLACVNRLRSGIGRRQQVFQLQQFVVFVCDDSIAEALRPLLAEEVGDAIACHAKQPPSDMLDRHQQAVRFHQLVEDIL